MATPANGGSVLSLQEAILLAKQRNGTIRRAAADVEASRARREATFGTYLPTLTPSLQYNNGRTRYDGHPTVVTGTNEWTTGINGNWLLTDAGERSLTYRAAQRNESATVYASRQTLRETLFQVAQQYYDTLRAIALQRVADTQVTRANTILQQTEARVEAGDAARKDTLQARADAMNAQVEAISARNETSTNTNNLKALIGWDSNNDLPPLEPVGSETNFPPVANLDALLTTGLRERADLAALRQSLEASKYQLRRTEIESGVSFSLTIDGNFYFTPDSGDNGSLTALLSIPLFDGGQRRAAVREQRADIVSSQSTLLQAERQARAEIESTYTDFQQDQQRLAATRSALEAAEINYQAALGSQQLGASDLIEVLTAQVSLVQAETNHIEAVFDTKISELRLALVTGAPLPGE